LIAGDNRCSLQKGPAWDGKYRLVVQILITLTAAAGLAPALPPRGSDESIPIEFLAQVCKRRGGRGARVRVEELWFWPVL
jgi:hypothetical protein